MPQDLTTTEFRWTAQREKAALLLAEDKLPDERIAGEVGVDRTTVARWKLHPAFRARVEQHVEVLREEALKHTIANQQKRLMEQNKRWQAMQTIREERGDDVMHRHVPGWRTGLLTYEQKSLSLGEDGAKLVDVYRFDAALVREQRELEDQVAKELGQSKHGDRGEKGGISISDSQVVIVRNVPELGI